MSTFESPAKLNFSLLVSSPRDDGYHPIDSLVQTIEWCDQLTVEPGDGSDHFEVIGSDLSVEGNLVTSALNALRTRVRIPPLNLRLEKGIPIEAGLGGGSSNAAAMLKAAEIQGWGTSEDIEVAASSVGADVALFLAGGSMNVTGVGESVEVLRPQEGFAVAVVAPGFGLSTAAVYRRWDEMEGPEGEVIPENQLPPSLREQMPMRNDLMPAAMDVDPRLGDFVADVRQEWGAAVCLTGSGSACFGYFGTVEEASHAALVVRHLTTVGKGVDLRPRGVASR